MTTERSKFIQLVAYPAKDDRDLPRLFALDDQGQVWVYEWDLHWAPWDSSRDEPGEFEGEPYTPDARTS